MDKTPPPFDRHVLESMNEKAIKNQLFTPDNVYIDLSLLKDFQIGAIYADTMYRPNKEDAFAILQSALLPKIDAYQKRTYDTVEPFFTDLGYSDHQVESILANKDIHDVVFGMSPATRFLDLLIRHTIRNQNNSRPAGKYTKTMINNDQYVMDAVPVTYHINTFPLSLSERLLEALGLELGESLGVNIKFINKDPVLFDQADWNNWMEKIDCFYLNSLGRFTRGDFVFRTQGEMAFNGCYFFARKRFEKEVMNDMQGVDFEQQVQMLTAQLDMFCDFAWLQNNDVRLTDIKEDVPVDTPNPDKKDGTPS